MAGVGKLFILLGGILILLGLAVLALGRANFPLGRLPGDIIFRGKHTTFYFPLATSIIVSIVLSVVLYFIARLRR